MTFVGFAIGSQATGGQQYDDDISRVGGVPSWHDISRVPKPDEIRCNHCGKHETMLFICQVYAPIENCQRSIYVFVCNEFDEL